MEQIIRLCFRCEYRAQFHEQGYAPRCECGDIKCAVYSCYQYKPVIPVILKKNKDDKRPQFAGSLLSARSYGSMIAQLNKQISLNIKKYRDGTMLYWRPIE
jgi:hypothetical protein